MIDDKVDFGTTEAELVVQVVGLCNNIDIARMWKDNGIAEEFIATPTTCKNITVTNCSGKYASEIQPSGGDNIRFKGLHGGSGNPGGNTGWEDAYTACYGNSIYDGFQSDTEGTIACLMINPGAVADETTITAGNPLFFKDGDLDMHSGDVIEFEQSYFAKGHTGFSGKYTTSIGTSSWFANEWSKVTLDFQYQLEGGSWNGSWLDVRTASNWTGITGNIEEGIKLKFRFTATGTQTSMSMLLIDTTTTLADQRDNFYPIDQVGYDFELTGLQNGTEVRMYKVSDDSELTGVENSSGGKFTDFLNFAGDVLVVIHHIDYQYISFNYTLTGSDVSIPIQQQFDSTYKNS
jgi:hypothetical protein